jgi:hypothetical protein
LVVVVVGAVVVVVPAEVVVWLLAVVLLDGALVGTVVGAVVGTVDPPAEVVVVLAADATRAVSRETTDDEGCSTLNVPLLGGEGKKAMVTSQLFRNRAPWLQSGIHVLSELLVFCRTPSAAGS